MRVRGRRSHRLYVVAVRSILDTHSAESCSSANCCSGESWDRYLLRKKPLSPSPLPPTWVPCILQAADRGHVLWAIGVRGTGTGSREQLTHTFVSTALDCNSKLGHDSEVGGDKRLRLTIVNAHRSLALPLSRSPARCSRGGAQGSGE